MNQIWKKYKNYGKIVFLVMALSIDLFALDGKANTLINQVPQVNELDIVDFGAIDDGVTLCTQAIQSAIDSIHENNGIGNMDPSD